jgi:predicted nucleic acid-binding protein
VYPSAGKFLATAKAARASHIVSEDEDLLVLGEWEGIKIVRAAAFLRLLEQRPQGS